MVGEFTRVLNIFDLTLSAAIACHRFALLAFDLRGQGESPVATVTWDVPGQRDVIGAEVQAEALIDVSRAPAFVRQGWDERISLWEAVVNLTYRHYQEHLPDLRAWADDAAAASAG